MGEHSSLGISVVWVKHDKSYWVCGSEGIQEGNGKRRADAPRVRWKKQADTQTITLRHLSLGVSFGSLSSQWGFDSF